MAGEVAFKWMQAPDGDRHIVRATSDVELSKLQLQPLGVFRLNTSLGPRPIELLNPSMAERPNHRTKCIARLYGTQADVGGRLRVWECVTDFSPLS